MADYAQAAEFAAEIAVEFLVANAVNNVQSDYIDLANNYYNLYFTQREFYFNTFQQQGELPFNTEQFGVLRYAPDYYGQTSAYYDALQPLVAAGYFPPGVWNWFGSVLPARQSEFVQRSGSTPIYGYWYRKAELYSPSGAVVTDASQSSYVDTAAIADDWNSYQNRYEEHKRDVFRERRWASQMGSLSYGVKEAYAVEREMGRSFEVFDEAQGQLVSAGNTLMNGLATFAAYRQMQKNLGSDLAAVPGYQQSYYLSNVIAN